VKLITASVFSISPVAPNASSSLKAKNILSKCSNCPTHKLLISAVMQLPLVNQA
jgi:hypothetical protein